MPHTSPSIKALCLALIILGGNSHAQWVQNGLPQGGYISCFASIGKNLFAGTDSGVYLSADSGMSWRPVNNGLPDTFIEAVAVRDTTLYCATHGSGVFLSRNSGGTWTPVNTGLSTTQVGSLGAGGTNLYAGIWGATFESTNGGGNWFQITNGMAKLFAYAYASIGPSFYVGTWDGVFLSPDSGQTWTQFSNGITDPWVLSLAAAGGNLFAGTYAGVYRSTNGGANWGPLNAGLTNLTVFSLAASAGGGNNLFAGTYGGGVFLSTNSGGVWIPVNEGLGNMYVKSLAVIGTDLVAGTFYGGGWRCSIQDLFNSLSTFTVNSGWNLVSLPRMPPDPATPGALFPGASPGTVYSYTSGNFQQPTELLTGEGYWAMYDSAGTNSISGTTTGIVTLAVPQGNMWVLFGTLTGSVPTSALTSDPPGAIVPGTIYSWNGSTYVQPTSLDPGRGYWVYVNAPCTLTVLQPGRAPGGGGNTRTDHRAAGNKRAGAGSAGPARQLFTGNQRDSLPLESNVR